MNSPTKYVSNRRLLITSMLIAVTIILVGSITYAIYIAYEREKSHLEANTIDWANTLVELSKPYLIENDKDGHNKLKEALETIINAPYISYVHVYKKNQDITFYTVFNKSVYYPSIPPKINEIEQLQTLTYKKERLELVVKIEHNEKVYGYLYIQSNLKSINSYIKKISYIGLIIFILGALFVVFLALWIQKRINQPINILVKSIKQISQSKDYTQRLDKIQMIELDILAQNINILLTRTQKHIAKQNDKHQQALLENANLTQKVTARTDALKESNQELLSTLEKLHQFQGQLVENEKMASLGDMVAGIAHEVNTPIGLGVTASSLMSDKLKEVKDSFEDKTLKSSQLKKFLIQGEENLGIIYRNLERAAKLISSFKKVAVDQSSADTRQFNVKELFEEILLTLKTKLDKNNVEINLDCPEELIVESKPGPISQILINLILNSIIHGFERKDDGNITISIMYLSQQLHVSYQDDGKGIDDVIKTRIFEPFTTTKRGSGGSGLGLHLVYNLVTQALNGHINFESTPGTGTTFDITLPVSLISAPE